MSFYSRDKIKSDSYVVVELFSIAIIMILALAFVKDKKKTLYSIVTQN